MKKFQLTLTFTEILRAAKNNTTVKLESGLKIELPTKGIPEFEAILIAEGKLEDPNALPKDAKTLIDMVKQLQAQVEALKAGKVAEATIAPSPEAQPEPVIPEPVQQPEPAPVIIPEPTPAPVIEPAPAPVPEPVEDVVDIPEDELPEPEVVAVPTAQAEAPVLELPEGISQEEDNDTWINRFKVPADDGKAGSFTIIGQNRATGKWLCKCTDALVRRDVPCKHVVKYLDTLKSIVAARDSAKKAQA